MPITCANCGKPITTELGWYCTNATTLTDSEQETFEALTANINISSDHTLTYEDLLADQFRLAVTDDGRQVNGFGAKFAIKLMKKMYPNKTDQELFEEQYGKVTWKDEK